MHVTRRDFLRATATASVPVALAGVASADHPRQQPDHVTLEYDTSMLSKYQPVLEMHQEDRQKFLGLHGWVAKSPEYDTDVCCYWAEYTHQESSPWVPANLDAHDGDHEPVQVEVNSETGEVERVRASIYHWIKGEATPAAGIPMDGTHPRLRVVNPHHQYTAASEDAAVEQFDVLNFHDSFQAWLDNGLEGDLLPGSSTNPWIMKAEGDFWANDIRGFSFNAAYVRAAKAAGVGKVGSLTR